MATPVNDILTQVGPNPLYVGFSFVLAITIIAISIARPIMSLFKDWRHAKVDDARSTAESALYSQLQGQIVSNTQSINRLVAEKDAWFLKASSLESEVNRLKVFEEMVINLRNDLKDKQTIIDLKDKQLTEFMSVILTMKDQIHDLEVRILRDETNGVFKQ